MQMRIHSAQRYAFIAGCHGGGAKCGKPEPANCEVTSRSVPLNHRNRIVRIVSTGSLTSTRLSAFQLRAVGRKTEFDPFWSPQPRVKAAACAERSLSESDDGCCPNRR